MANLGPRVDSVRLRNLTIPVYAYRYCTEVAVYIKYVVLVVVVQTRETLHKIKLYKALCIEATGTPLIYSTVTSQKHASRSLPTPYSLLLRALLLR